MNKQKYVIVVYYYHGWPDNLGGLITYEMCGSFTSSPSYGGQWAFRDCKRVGRAFIWAHNS